MDKETKRTHPSYGKIAFTRTNSNGTEFFGSELKQDNYVSLEIHNAEVVRDLSCDRYYTDGPVLVRARMSSAQFAELITSMNVGSGVCCTIERLAGKKVEEYQPQESRKELVHNEFKERMKEFAVKLKDKQTKAKELINKKTLSKEDMHNLNFHIEWLTQEVYSNIPYFAERFQETMDTVVHEAKLEVENAIQHKISVLGLNELHNQNKLLSDGNL
jgi:hypothetical protein